MKKLIMLPILCTLLAGCGVKGPLYLPADNPPEQERQQAPAPQQEQTQTQQR